MPKLTFFHPMVYPNPTLVVNTGVDEISWGYNMNTSTYPTYGGEVVQILSCYIDDLQLMGTVASYHKQEQIYSYFAQYLQIATQGRSRDPYPGLTSYNQEPILMTYPERGWQFHIIATNLPSFRQGRDIIAPQWRLTAHVVDDEDHLHNVKEFTKATVLEQFLNRDNESFGWTGRIGFRPNDPFSGPSGNNILKEFDPSKGREDWMRESDRFKEVVNSYLGADVDQIFEALASRPTTTSGDTNGENSTEQEAKDRGSK